jgi:branched-chain amino acid transport system ATP-binding protein
MLEFQEVHTYYGNSHILQGVSFRVNESSVGVLLGRNGMGKSTTLHSAIGFAPPAEGKVLFKGDDITRCSSYRIARRGMALVPQGCRIFPSLTVRENLLIAARRARKETAWTLEKVFELFPVLMERQIHKGNHLSGGERQMLAICRGLISNPDFLLLDEPTEGLAPLVIQELGRIIGKLKSRGLSILMAEQNFPFALKMADHVCILHKGTVVFKGLSKELEANMEVQDLYLAV